MKGGTYDMPIPWKSKEGALDNWHMSSHSVVPCQRCYHSAVMKRRCKMRTGTKGAR